MSLVKYGGGITQMSGSIGGTVFARNRFGNYCRSRTKPTNPQTQLQTNVREAVQQLSTRWAQTLIAAKRTAWNLYGNSVAMKNKLGETIYLTGMNHYLRSNSFRQIIGLPIVDDGPTIFELPEADSKFAITASEATQEISYTFDTGLAWGTEVGGWMLLYQGSPQNPQRNFFNGPWRFNAALEGTAMGPGTSPRAIAVKFAIAQDQRQWAYARIARADGRISEVFRADCFCGT